MTTSMKLAAPWFVAFALGAQAAQEPKKPQASTASDVIAAVKKAVGDLDALAKAGPFRFDVSIGNGEKTTARRTVTWSPNESRARIDLDTNTGKVSCALALADESFAVESAGKRLAGDEAAKVHAQLRKTFAGDLNYLTLPLRLGDPKLTVEYRGAVVVDGETLDRLEIRYPAPHPLAGDTYFLIVDRASGMPQTFLVRWSNMKKEQAPLRFDYTEWRVVGATKVPRTMTGVGHSQRIDFEPCEAGVKVDPEHWLDV
jgi:hypothetical protein